MLATQQKRAPLEQKQRLSRSILWKWQRTFFEREGPRAWSEGKVPHQITSGPFIADAYSRMVFGFLRDASAALDPAQPLYVVELGSGPGRFAYLFVKRLLDRCRESALRDLPWRYVMTDFAERNVEVWEEHPWLQPFLAAGQLDTARFDVEADRELRLRRCGETLGPGTVRNPLVVIANYVFDSIPQDAFTISDGQLYEALVTLRTRDREPDLDDPALLHRVEISYHQQAVQNAYYENPRWNELLEDYRRRLPSTAFLFPTAALACIENLLEFAAGRLLVLSADRGFSRDEALVRGQGQPQPSLHGSFSLAVDYQILGEHCRRLGGEALHPSHRAKSLNLSAFLFGDSAEGFTETRQAYAEAVEPFGPDDYFTLREGFARVDEHLSLEQILAFLRLSGWDPRRFRECLPVLKRHLQTATPEQRQDLHVAVQRVWDAYLPIGEEDDLAFHLGTLLIEMELYPEALTFLRHSVALYGVEPGTAYNLAVCHHQLRQHREARDWIARALELDPDFDAARALRVEIEAEV